MLLAEKIISLLLQAVLGLTFLSSVVLDIIIRLKRSKLSMSVKRGNTSWEHLIISYNILAIFFISVVSVSIFFNPYRIFIIIADQIILIYLCFISSWFRNKIIGMWSKIKSLKEIHKK